MTVQIADNLRFKGCSYCILKWEGNTDCLPTSEALGFTTITASTNNMSGRVDHYGVWGDELYLFKIEVILENPDDTPTPPNARREILKRYEQFVDYDGNPTRLKEHRYDFFIYEELVLPFSGRIIVEESENSWEVPMRAQEEDEKVAMSLGLEFQDGRLIDVYQVDSSDLITEFR